MPIVYPDSWWSYSMNAVFYWPYRDDEHMTADPNYVLPMGDHRYFRYNVRKPNFKDIVLQAGAAGIWVRNISCYDATDRGEVVQFCEGFLEPKYAGMTLYGLEEKLLGYNLEVSMESSDFVDEALQDIDDYLTMDYHTVHPVRMAEAGDILHPNSYYPTTLIYRGNRAGTYRKAPPPEFVAKFLRERDMGFFQPYKVVEPNSTTFILKTGNEETTPQKLAVLLNADAAIVNLQTLDPKSQVLIQENYTGETSADKVVRYFTDKGEQVADDADTLLKVVRYASITAVILGGAWLGLKAYPYMRDAYEDAARKRVRSGA